MKRRVMAIVIALTLIIGFLNIQGKIYGVNAQTNKVKATITFDGDGGKMYGLNQTYNVDGDYTSGYYCFDNMIVVECEDGIVPNCGYPTYGEYNGKALDYFYIEGETEKYYLEGAVTTPAGALYIKDYVPNGNVTFKAHYIDAYKVTFKGNGGNYNSNLLNKENGDLVIYIGKNSIIGQIGYTARSIRDGYAFDGYKDLADNTVYSDGPGTAGNTPLYNYVVSSDSVFESTWREHIRYHIIFNPNGGKFYWGKTSNVDYVYDMGVDCSGDLDDLDGITYSDSCKSFAGWKSGKDGKVYSLDEVKKLSYITSVTENVTFTAQWNPVSNNGGNKGNNTSNSGSKSTTPQKSTKKYSNEWVDGKWYNADGSQTYKGTMKWKNNSKGWWIEDSAGWYPKSQWQKIDGKWYYFCSDGYMDYSEYRDGCWLGSDGAWIESYSGGKWSLDGTGWWYSDSSGWYPSNQWLWIDGTNYHFNAKGYCTNP